MEIPKKEITERLSVLFFLTIIVFITYSNTFNAGFYYDDLGNIVRNQTIKDLGNFFEIIKGQRPVGMLTFALNYYFDGLNPQGYHIVNLLIHIVTSFLVYLLMDLTIKKYTHSASKNDGEGYTKISIFTSLLFAVHPIQTQAVTYIVQRTEALASLFMLLAVILFATKEQSKSKVVSGFSVVGIFLAYFFGFFTKEIAITIPALILFYDIFFISNFRFGSIYSKKWFYAALFLTSLFFTVTKLISFQETPDGSAGFVLKSITAKEYFFTQFNVIITYIRLLAFPFNQNLDYDYPIVRTLFESKALLSFLLISFVIVGSILSLIIFRRSTKVRVVVFFVFWFFITLFPTSSFIPILDVIYEHRLYLPSLAFFASTSFIVFWVSETSLAKKKSSYFFTLIFLLITILFSVKTYHRNGVWKNGVTLWTDVSLKSPGKARTNNNLGDAYMEINEYDKAIPWFKKSIETDRFYVEPHFNLALCYIKKKEYEKALPEFDEVLRINSFLGGGHFGVARDPKFDLMAHANMGNLYNLKRDYEKAIYHYKEVVKLDPKNVSTLYNMAITFKTIGRYEEAIENFKAILRIDPKDKGAKINLDQMLGPRY